ncbi:substrate-binding domain-containing protein [uncultured Propionivibrio sp.]|uniref:substrate-binding domain-containing protein n=1 Tax=uncultured Propionivibrio sp. TaxID=426737 RepID=UPI0029BFBE9A|nr:substrate-binding domain-containing protein [uncultured Propionivibrio sp.]
MVHLAFEHVDGDGTDYYFSNLGVSPPVVLQSNDTHLISAMTAVGFGVAFLPDWGIQRELQDGTLVPLNIPGPRLFEEFGTMYLSKGMSATTEEFVRFCKEHNDLLPEISRGGLHREAELPPSRS